MTNQSQTNNTLPNQDSDSAQESPTQNLSTFTTWLDILSFLLKTKNGLTIIGILIIFLGTIISLSLYFTRPEEIEITTKAGTITLKRGSKQDGILLLNPVGADKNSPWVSTGIIVKANDKVTITASGRVNTSLKRIVTAAQTDEETESLWVDPQGSKLEDDFFKERNKHKLLPDKDGAYYGYGMLLAAVKDSKSQIKQDNIQPIGSSKTFTTPTDGELVLTVNDIWLSNDKKEVYARPLNEENFQYYLSKAQYEAALKSEDFNSWSERTKKEKANEQYQNRLKHWENITKTNNWNVWYNDNIGAFSVSVSINK
ncbi:hypothetical protein [Nostoc sp. UHCC 0251]|uniref:hypothetical protein n=1 Tax=Nostoc sp. UHCC 0251 TaxID=3110240 RepID=UPI002B2034D4|nr:hypothetical protein [Nostoc sp. UHCC 0251]MEA5626525.1 hypothetical protein [Nostoc sp. UHCC 0251]